MNSQSQARRNVPNGYNSRNLQENGHTDLGREHNSQIHVDMSPHPVLSPQTHRQESSNYRIVRQPPSRHVRGILSKMPPYLQRGTTVFLCGYVGGLGIMGLFALGAVMLMVGLFIIFTGGGHNSVAILLIGGAFIVIYIILVRKARREYNNLPENHPDRIYYGGTESTSVTFTPTTLPVTTNNPTIEVIQATPAAAIFGAVSGAEGYSPGPTTSNNHLTGHSSSSSYNEKLAMGQKPPTHSMQEKLLVQATIESQRTYSASASSEIQQDFTLPLEQVTAYNSTEDQPPAYDDLFKEQGLNSATK